MKKVTFTPKPTVNKSRPTADDWVQQKPLIEGKMKRLTIDLPESLHTRVKSQCVLRGTTMLQIVRDFLEREFPQEIKTEENRPKPSSGKSRRD